MPIYSYKCSECGKVFDKLQKPGSDGKAKCESCDGKAVRIFSPVGIIFKGSGFYKTDYSSSSSLTQNKKEEKKTEQKETKKEETAKSKEK